MVNLRSPFKFILQLYSQILRIGFQEIRRDRASSPRKLRKGLRETRRHRRPKQGSPDMERIQMNLKRLSLTDIVIDINRVPKKKILIEAMENADVKNKWEKNSWGRKLIVQKRRAALNDFDRFQIMLAKIKRAGVVRQELAKLNKEITA
ncbi:hypothetical protein Bca101_074659 [Brassica carinata]